MLGNIFSEKISLHNVNYKDLMQRMSMEDGLDAHQPLEDVGEYIEFINQQFKTMQVMKCHFNQILCCPTASIMEW